MDASQSNATNQEDEPLSMQRLRAAFARMLGDKEESARSATAATGPTPEGIVEAALFVGSHDDAPLSAERLAGVMRDVTPDEVRAHIDSLERRYHSTGAAYRIEQSPDGFRLALRDGLERVADRIGSRVRAAKLSVAALETLSVVAYRQPISASEVEAVRGAPAAATLRTLARRGLVRVDDPDGTDPPKYGTTDRFLRLLDLGSLEQLPRIQELDD